MIRVYCVCGAPANMLGVGRPMCLRCWIASDQCVTGGCSRIAIPHSGHCWEHDPAVVWLDSRLPVSPIERLVAA